MSPTPSISYSAIAVALAALAVPLTSQTTVTGPAWEVHGLVAGSRSTHGGVGFGAVWGGLRRVRIAPSLTAVMSGDGVGARAEVHAQFHILPGRRPTWSIYGTGGAGYLSAAGLRGSPFIVTGMGIERRPAGTRSEYLEVGLGRGLRIALGVRFRRRSADR